MPVDEAYISQYGVIIPSSDGNGVIGVVEKPRQDEAPSNLASVGRYILTQIYLIHLGLCRQVLVEKYS